MINKSLTNIYKRHHSENRPANFSVLEKERGLLLKKLVGINKRVLDIGSRDGVLTRHFIEGNSVKCVDVDEHALNLLRKRLGAEILVMDLNGGWDDLGGEKFDVVVAGEVLEHLYNPDQIVRKVAVHLNDGGLLLGSVPNAFSLKNRLRYLFGSKRHTPLSDPTHINQFSCRELKDILKRMFSEVDVVGIGRYARLSRIFPNFVAFDLFFIAKNPTLS